MTSTSRKGRGGPGVDYTAAPTCATCHMSATRTSGVTHDVGERIGWTLRPAVSTKLNMVVYEDLRKDDLPEGAAAEGRRRGQGQRRRDRKVRRSSPGKNAASACKTYARAATQRPVNGFYRQFDNLVDLYNDKFAKPATAIMDELYKANKLTAAQMDEKLEWTYYELWHHEGRRARHGASMSGPD